jgi:ABC-type nitrate/sulfonate/bicarbonate transport system substrate-binding protein
VAQEAGLLAKHGLEVELTNVGGRAATQGLLSGELSAIVSSGIEVVASGLAGGDAVIVASGLNTLDMSIWARGVTQPAGLRGKRVGVSQIGESTDFAMRYALRQWGLEPGTDVEVLQTGQPPQRLAALETGAVEATIIQPPLTVRARKAGLQKLAEVADMGLEYQHTSLIATRRRLAEDPEPIGRLVRAWAEAMYYYRAQPEASQTAVGRFMQLEDPEALAETYAHYDRLYVRPPYPTLKGLQAILDVLADEDARARDHRPEEFVDTGLLDRLQQAGQFQTWEQQYPPAL